MAKGNTFDNDLLLLAFNATAFSWNANTQLWMSLNTADPTSAGTAATSEATYTGYARVAINRNSGGFTVSGASVVNAAQISFPACTGGSSTVTNFCITTAVSGASEILYTGALTASLAISNGITPIVAAGQLSITES